MKRSLLALNTFLILSFFSVSCANSGSKQCVSHEKEKSCCLKQAAMPEWSKDAVIYEVNMRQYTPEGTIAAFTTHLPRLKELGVEILWIMPIQPISKVNRKGTLGSYYAIADYKKVNPEFGTMDDFKVMVAEAHKLGMKVILDWVANHTGWDHTWISAHPEWYTHDSVSGKIIAPVADWTDVADLNYNNKEMRQEMTSSMVYWVKEADLDGFRCDVAGMVPTDFWNDTRDSLEAVKPMFMLAEDEEVKDLTEKAFNAYYGWNMHWRLNQIAQGKQDAASLKGYFAHKDSVYPAGSFAMQFTSNHDENSWNKTEYVRMGDAVKTMAALTYVLPGMPLIYSGQEAANKKSLRFFDKDTIDFSSTPLASFYKQLADIKVNHPALWNGSYGSKLVDLSATPQKSIYAFSRTKENDQVVAIFNLSKDEQTVSTDQSVKGSYVNLLTGQVVELPLNGQKLAAWDYLILSKK